MASASGPACEQPPPSPSQRTAAPVPVSKGKRRPFPLLELSQIPRDSLKSDASVENGDHESGVEDSRRSSTSSGADVDPAVAYIRLQNVMQRQKGLAGKIANGTEPVTPFPQLASGDLEDILDIASSRPQTPQASWPAGNARNRRASADDVQRPSACGTPSRSSGRRPSRTLLDMPTLAGEGNDHLNGKLSAAASAPAPPLQRSRTAPCVERRALETQEEDAHEAERIGLIMRHLEEMNNSAADLNLVQQDLAECAKDRQRLLQLWAVGSARLARAVGSHRLAKARPYYEQRRRCAEKQAAVKEASRKFLAASKAAAPEAELQDLAAKHALCLAAFQDAQRKFSKFKPSSYTAASPYFEAEEENRLQLEEADAGLRHCSERVQAAKARYRLALRSLEELSEQAHLNAALAANAVPASSSQASSIGTPRHSPCGGTARSPAMPGALQRQVSSESNKAMHKSAPPGVSQVYRQDSLDSQDSLEESHDASESQGLCPDLADDATVMEPVDDAAETAAGAVIEPQALVYEAAEENRHRDVEALEQEALTHGRLEDAEHENERVEFDTKEEQDGVENDEEKEDESHKEPVKEEDEQEEDQRKVEEEEKEVDEEDNRQEEERKLKSAIGEVDSNGATSEAI